MDIQKTDTAVVFIDPQSDVPSEKGANWGAVGASVCRVTSRMCSFGAISLFTTECFFSNTSDARG